MTHRPVQEILGNLDLSKLAQQVERSGPEPTVQRAARRCRRTRPSSAACTRTRGPGGEAPLSQALPSTDNDLTTGTIDASRSAEGEAKVVHICGSTRFAAEFARGLQRLTMQKDASLVSRS